MNKSPWRTRVAQTLLDLTALAPGLAVQALACAATGFTTGWMITGTASAIGFAGAWVLLARAHNTKTRAKTVQLGPEMDVTEHAAVRAGLSAVPTIALIMQGAELMWVLNVVMAGATCAHRIIDNSATNLPFPNPTLCLITGHGVIMTTLTNGLTTTLYRTSGRHLPKMRVNPLVTGALVQTDDVGEQQRVPKSTFAPA